MRRGHLIAAPLACLALGLAACGGEDEEAGGGQAAATGTTQEQATGASGCRSVEAPEPKGPQDLPQPRLRVEEGREYRAILHTSCGDVVVDLASEDSPRTVASFVSLARENFYDTLIFHRIAEGFVIQGGDPQGDGTGGPGYSVTEAPPEDVVYDRGTVAMAKTEIEEAGTSGSQFFIVTAEDAGLPPDYAVLGQVIEGMDVVDRIAAVRYDPTTEQPLEPVLIEDVEIQTSDAGS